MRCLSEDGHELSVLLETGSPPSSYSTAHSFEADRDAYERGLWFSGRDVRIAEIARTKIFDTVNEAAVEGTLRQMDPQVIIVFGTRRISSELIAVNPGGIVNLHGGDPESYRGLDTHLWAIWHREFSQLVTTLHRLDAQLDNGEVIAKQAVPLRRNMKLHELRVANTDTCVDLARRAISDFAKYGRFDSRPQQAIGRYYSAMPTDLKTVCVERFARHTGKLP